MQKLNQSLRFIDTACDWLGKIVSYLIFPLIAVVMFEVLMRYLLRRSQLWSPETSEFLFAAIFVMGSAYTFIHGGFVRMDAIFGRLSPGAQIILDLVTSVLAFIFVGVLLWKGWLMSWDSLMMFERSQTAWSPPIYPVKLMIPLGAVLLLLELVVKFIRDLSKAIKGNRI